MKQYFAVGNWHDAGTGPFPTITYDVLSNWEWRDKPQEFKREIRYEVYKRKDIDSMPPAARKKARELLAELNALLDGYGVAARKCVVVEGDWPEYEKVWQMIEERVTSKPADEVHPNEEGRRRIAEAVTRELRITPPGHKEPLISIDPAQQGGDYGCRLECTVQPDGAVQVENVERIGEQCIDGGKCHHNCKERCFRRECCAPFSTYDGPWKYEIPDHAGKFFRADDAQTINDDDSVLTTAELLAVDCRAAIPVDERIRYARAIEAAVLRKLVTYAIDEGDN